MEFKSDKGRKIHETAKHRAEAECGKEFPSVKNLSRKQLTVATSDAKKLAKGKKNDKGDDMEIRTSVPIASPNFLDLTYSDAYP
jgi:predicted ribonuclease toxin of YeeF-YezG toxin-antitoxin module